MGGSGIKERIEVKVKWGGKFRGKPYGGGNLGDEVPGDVHKNSVSGKYPVTVPIRQRRSVGLSHPLKAFCARSAQLS